MKFLVQTLPGGVARIEFPETVSADGAEARRLALAAVFRVRLDCVHGASGRVFIVELTIEVPADAT